MWRTAWRCWRATATVCLSRLLNLSRPQKIHQHPCFCPSSHRVPRASCVHQVAQCGVPIFFYIRECEGVLWICYQGCCSQTKSQINTGEGHHTKCEVTVNLVRNRKSFCFQLFVRSRIYFVRKCMNENVLQSKKRNNRKASKIMNVWHFR